MILRDCCEMYNTLHTYISCTIESIFKLDEDASLKLDQLYSDLIKLTKPMSSLFQLKNQFAWVANLQAPRLYQLDKEFNRKEELYVNAIRKRNRAPLKQRVLATTFRHHAPANGASGNRNNSMEARRRRDQGYQGQGKVLNTSHDSPLKPRVKSKPDITTKLKGIFTGHEYASYENLGEDTDRELLSSELPNFKSGKQGDRKLLMEDEDEYVVSPIQWGKKGENYGKLSDALSPSGVFVANEEKGMNFGSEAGGKPSKK